MTTEVLDRCMNCGKSKAEHHAHFGDMFQVIYVCPTAVFTPVEVFHFVVPSKDEPVKP